MTFVDRAGERVAREVDRRGFLRRSAGVVFGFATAVALAEPARVFGADTPCPNSGTTATLCYPPGVGYCSGVSASYCDGSNCAGGCSFSHITYPSTGCWCSRAYCTPGGRYGYWRCCDCHCPNGSGGFYCGCHAFHQISTCSSSSGSGADPTANQVEASNAG